MSLLAFLFLLGKVFAIAAGLYYIKYLTAPYRLALYLTAIALFCEGYGYYLYRYLKLYNAWLFNLYMVVEVWCMIGAALYLMSGIAIKRIFFVLLLANTAFWFAVILRNIYTFAYLPMISGCLLMTSAYIYVLIDKGIFNKKDVVSQPVFWLSISIILFAACDIPYMAMHGYVEKNAASIKLKLQHINSILDILRYPLAGISFILLGKSGKKTQLQ